MYNQCRKRLGFASATYCQSQITSHLSIKSQKDQFLDFQRQKHSSTSSSFVKENVPKDQIKVLKLIGDKEENIQELIQGFSCVCGCKTEFKNVVNLLFDKIYRLRDERNQLKAELAYLKQNIQDSKDINIMCTVGTNTSNDDDELNLLHEHLRSLEDEKGAFKAKKQLQISMTSEQIENLFERQNQLLNLSKLNETNLLESPFITKEYQKENLFYSEEQGLVLDEVNFNRPKKMNDVNQLIKKNHISLTRLEEYIQKKSCARQLNSYGEDKRKMIVF